MRAILLIGTNFARTQWLPVAIMTAYLAGIGGVFGWHEQYPDVRFFLQWHSYNVLFVVTMIAIPAIWSERRSRRILAVLSKGIGRWQYLGGILCGCAMVSAWLCLLVGVITTWLCHKGRLPAGGLPAVTLVLFLCCVTAASVAVFCSAFLHPLLAAVATFVVLLFPLATEAAGWYLPGEMFPVSALVDVLRSFQFRPPGTGIWAIAASAAVETIFFWMAGSAIFARRDVTISPE
jgi:ABC-type transport system involved in multi-copper enzyme maturation permease subunit